MNSSFTVSTEMGMDERDYCAVVCLVNDTSQKKKVCMGGVSFIFRFLKCTYKVAFEKKLM